MSHVVDIVNEYNEFKKLQEALERTVKVMEYWNERCKAAEKFIDLSPCDPDFTKEQFLAYGEWLAWKDKIINL